jgi:hypothetical protein
VTATTTGGGSLGAPAVACGARSVVEGAVALLERGVDQLAEVDVDALADDEVQRCLAIGERTVRRVQALQATLASTLTRRRAAAAKVERPDDPRAPQRAARAVRTEMTDELGITPSQAKQMTATGSRLEHLPATASAYRDGALTDRHVAVIDEVAAHSSGDARDEFELELVALAGRCRDAVVFGREARRLLAERDHDAAMADLDRKQARRRGAVAQDAEGCTRLMLTTAGYAGELVHTVVDAFRTPDGPGVHRTAEQRTHDAILAAFEVALRAGEAPTQHGVRPHVSLVVPAEAVRPRDGVVETTWTGPLPYGEVARLLADCSLARIVADAKGTPVSVTRQVRTVPMGLWRLLVVRDGGCIWEGCDAPAGWCQVAHLEDTFVDGGMLSPNTAGLLCTAGPNHHARYDHGDYRVVWFDGHPQVVHGDGTPVGERARPAWGATQPPSSPSATSSPSSRRRSGQRDPGGTSPPEDPPVLFARERPPTYRAGSDPPGAVSRRPPTDRDPPATAAA